LALLGVIWNDKFVVFIQSHSLVHLLQVIHQGDWHWLDPFFASWLWL
jgi:hypothetical protein